jgi:hypothetical protein
MLKNRRQSHGLREYFNQFTFQDTDPASRRYFRISNLPDQFFVGKNAFDLAGHSGVFVPESRIYIDLLDAAGQPIYYEILNVVNVDQSRTVVVHVYPDTPAGRATLYVAGRLATDPRTGQPIPYSTDPSSEVYRDIPNLVWRTELNVVLTRTNTTVIRFVREPEVIFKEKREAYQTVSRAQRRTVTTPVSASVSLRSVGMPSQYTTTGLRTRSDAVETGVRLTVMPSTTGSVGVSQKQVVLPEFGDLPVVTVAGFPVSASMKGGLLTVRSIAVSESVPRDATDPSVFNVPDYSASIVEVLSSSSFKVNQPFQHKISYSTTSGQQREIIIDRFVGQQNFSITHYENVEVTKTRTTQSFVTLEFKHLEPAVGTVDAVRLSYKPVGSFGDFTPIGEFPIREKNLLVDTGSVTFDNDNGLIETPKGVFTSTEQAKDYWGVSGSGVVGASLVFDESRLSGGIKVQHSGSPDDTSFVLLQVAGQAFEATENTEYRLTFSAFAEADFSASAVPQFDVYVSGSPVTTDTTVEATRALQRPEWGTFIGSVTAKEARIDGELPFRTQRTAPARLFIAIRRGNWHLGNIEVKPRKEYGFSPNQTRLSIPTSVFNKGAEMIVNVDYVNADGVKANASSKLYGVYFSGSVEPVLRVPGGPIDLSYPAVGKHSQTTYLAHASFTPATESVVNVRFPVFYLGRDAAGSADRLAHTASHHVVALLYEVDTVAYAYSGSISGSLGGYVFGSTLKGRAVVASWAGSVPELYPATSASFGGGSSFSSSFDDSLYISVSASYTTDRFLQVTHVFRTSKAVLAGYITSTCRVLKYEYEVSKSFGVGGI